MNTMVILLLQLKPSFYWQKAILCSIYPKDATGFLFSIKTLKCTIGEALRRFDTPQKAMQEFVFFQALLNYSGNIYIEKNETDCRYRIYIREVLALSKLSFPTPAQAWGINGVEKFICIAQTENGFHNYLNRKNCDHSFYVACANTGLIHPCKYETPKRRDNALNKLYQSASFNFFDLLEVDAENNLSLLGLDKKPIANLFINKMIITV